MDLLAETCMLEYKLTDTPITVNHSSSIRENQVLTDREKYQRLVGRVIYLSHTRLDIAYTVSVINQFMYASSKDHIEAIY